MGPELRHHVPCPLTESALLIRLLGIVVVRVHPGRDSRKKASNPCAFGQLSGLLSQLSPHLPKSPVAYPRAFQALGPA